MGKLREAIMNGDVSGDKRGVDAKQGIVYVKESIKLRPEILRFAEAMERKLCANEHKGSWKESTVAYLNLRVDLELAEFRVALGDRPPAKILGEAADVANFVMMICDVRGEL